MMMCVILSFYGLANIMRSGSNIINHKKKIIIEESTIRSIVLLFSIGLLYVLLERLRLRFFFSFPNRCICMIKKSFSPCVDV